MDKPNTQTTYYLKKLSNATSTSSEYFFDLLTVLTCNISNRKVQFRTFYFEFLSFLRHTFLYSLNFIFTIVLTLLLALPIYMTITGATNLKNCPLNTLIPIWLIFGGFTMFITQLVGIISNFIEIISQRKDKQNGIDENRKKQINIITRIFSILRVIFSLGLLSWLIGATILGVINRLTVSYDSTNTTNFCNQTCINMIFINPIVLWSVIRYIRDGSFHSVEVHKKISGQTVIAKQNLKKINSFAMKSVRFVVIILSNIYYESLCYDYRAMKSFCYERIVILIILFICVVLLILGYCKSKMDTKSSGKESQNIENA